MESLMHPFVHFFETDPPFARILNMISDSIYSVSPYFPAIGRNVVESLMGKLCAKKQSECGYDSLTHQGELTEFFQAAFWAKRISRSADFSPVLDQIYMEGERQSRRKERSPCVMCASESRFPVEQPKSF
jgi:hypothetical protein